MEGYTVKPTDPHDVRTSWVCWQQGKPETRTAIVAECGPVGAAQRACEQFDGRLGKTPYSTWPKHRTIVVEAAPDSVYVVPVVLRMVRQWELDVKRK